MKIREIREQCLKAVAWLPVCICLGLVGWSYYVFVFSACGYLFRHEHIIQGIIYLITCTTIVVLLIWSYSLASFASPGYPNEAIRKYTEYNRAIQDDAVNVGLLEPEQPEQIEQFYLSPSQDSSSEGQRVTNGERLSNEGDVTGTETQLSPNALGMNNNATTGFDLDINDPWLEHDLSSSGLPPLPRLQPVNQGHTVVQIGDASNRHFRSEMDTYPHQQHPGNNDNNRRNHGNYRRDMDDDEDDSFGRSTTRFTVKQDGKKRYCQKCKFDKPDRTHHCSSCKRCVLKMDHHCPWLNNCVGHRNYKAFFLFVFWTAVYCIALVACTISVAAMAETGEFDPQWIFMILVGMVFGLCLVPFAIHHFFLMKNNKTTIESFEKHKYRVGNSGEVMQSRVLNVFDLGYKKNFIQVLGPVWYLWLIPVRNSLGDGWSFPASEYGKSMLCIDNESLAPSTSSHWTPRTSTSQLTLYHTQYQGNRNHNHHPHHGHGDFPNETPDHVVYDVNDFSDLENDRRPDSDESDSEETPHRRRYQLPPRRFRNQQEGFSYTADSDEETEEYVYDSDEPVTIRFSDKGGR